MNFEEYQDLQGTGYQAGAGEKLSPEDEFFHSVYISGKSRKNHANIVEKVEKFQIRGVEYNLEEVNMIITHTKDILAKVKSEKGKETTECFSFKDGAPPWFGTSTLPDGSKRPCPNSSAERAAVDFCNPCRSQIIMAGIYCNENGKPILSEEGKPVFIFIRGKGMRYAAVSDYLSDRYKEDLTPIFEPVTEQSQRFEKEVVNNKRFVTNITRTTATSSYDNEVNIFKIEKGIELPAEAVMKILKLSKDTVAKFNEKFNWAKGKGGTTTGYGSVPEGVLPMESAESTQKQQANQTETKTEETSSQEEQETKAPENKKFSFDDFQF